MGGRFSAPVYPGDTLAVQVWDEPGGNFRFRVRVEERDITAFDFGQARLVA
jgi:acyl dehydratase